MEDIRTEIDSLISRGSGNAAAARLDTLWRNEPTPASAAFMVTRVGRLRGQINLQPFRVAVLRSFTLEPAIPLLRAAAFRYRIDLEVLVGEYNSYMQEILDDKSSLYAFKPDVVILAIRTADICPDLWQDYSMLSPQSVEDAIERVQRTLRQAVVTLRERTQATVIIHTLEQPLRAASGVLDTQSGSGQCDAIQTMNQDLRHFARQLRGVYVLDYDALVARHGRQLWQDERKFLSFRLPIAANNLIHLADEWLRLLVPLSGKVAKALVVDLDNTLWGGVVGEDEMTGIKLGDNYPGPAYQALQRALLELSRRGVLLAICSKNNSDDAMEVLEKHPDMLLRPNHFSAMRINWNDKAQGLREIAAELNLGLDSLAFLDDNPFEREQLRNLLPEVLVIDVPQDPVHYAAAIYDCPAFERLTLSAEDQQRAVLYAEQRKRSSAEQRFQTKEDFYRYLEQEAEIEPASSATLTRIAQLTQRTNQFNLTTRRYSEQQIAERAAHPGVQVLSIRVKDRFGDHGSVGVAITCDDGDTCEIDTFLLSCRVIGRSVETALLSHLVQSAAARGCRKLAGWFLPTRKNAPAKDFYRQSGFECRMQKDEGTLWILDLQSRTLAAPNWIKLTIDRKGSVSEEQYR